MPTIYTENLRLTNLSSLSNLISTQSLYVFFANPIPWTNESSPDVPLDSQSSAASIWSDMLYLKKVSDYVNVAPRYSWNSGTRYSQYDSALDISDLTRTRTFVPALLSASVSAGALTIQIVDPGLGYQVATLPVTFSAGTAVATANFINGSLFSVTVTGGNSGYSNAPTVTVAAPSTISSSVFSLNPYYIVTDALNVYQCLGNNSGAPSTVKPTSTSTSGSTPSALADGYIWKYMYTISSTDEEKFLNPNYFPVRTLAANDSSAQWSVQVNASGGRGSNAIAELNAVSLMVKVRVNGSEGGTIVDTNDYRQVGLILNPVAFGSTYTPVAVGTNTLTLNASHDVSNNTALWYPNAGKLLTILSGPGAGQVISIASYSAGVVTLSSNWSVLPDTTSTYGIISNALVVNQCTVLKLGTTTGGTYTQDSVVMQSTTGATARMVKFDSVSNPNLLYLSLVSGTFDSTHSVSSGSVSSSVTGKVNPGLTLGKGSILMLDNRRAVSRFSDNAEDYRAVIQF